MYVCHLTSKAKEVKKVKKEKTINFIPDFGGTRQSQSFTFMSWKKPQLLECGQASLQWIPLPLCIEGMLQCTDGVKCEDRTAEDKLSITLGVMVHMSSLRAGKGTSICLANLII